MECPVLITSKGESAAYSASAFNKAAIISQYLSSPSGRATIAASMANPIRRNLGYAGIARKCLTITPLPAGALPTYDKDIDVSSVIVNQDEKSTQMVEDSLWGNDFTHQEVLINASGNTNTKLKNAFSKRVTIPTFEIYNSPTVSISDIRTRRFSLIDRKI